jgi:4,5-dihydroxyphthalate decarboxylase
LVAIHLWTAFERAKARSYARLFDSMGWRFPLPWVTEDAEAVRRTFGDDFYPYGLEANRTTLDAFLGFAHEQGVAARRLAVEDLFAPTTHRALRL